MVHYLFIFIKAVTFLISNILGNKTMVESGLLLNYTLLPVVTWPKTQIICFLLNFIQNNDLDQKYINY